MASLAEKKLFLFDLDGTLYLDGILFKGTLPLLRTGYYRGRRTVPMALRYPSHLRKEIEENE